MIVVTPGGGTGRSRIEPGEKWGTRWSTTCCRTAVAAPESLGENDDPVATRGPGRVSCAHYLRDRDGNPLHRPLRAGAAWRRLCVSRPRRGGGRCHRLWPSTCV